MKKSVLLVIILFGILMVFDECKKREKITPGEIDLQPNATEGKDAYFKTTTPDMNQGDHTDITALA